MSIIWEYKCTHTHNSINNFSLFFKSCNHMLLRRHLVYTVNDIPPNCISVLQPFFCCDIQRWQIYLHKRCNSSHTKLRYWSAILITERLSQDKCRIYMWQELALKIVHSLNICFHVYVSWHKGRSSLTCNFTIYEFWFVSCVCVCVCMKPKYKCPNYRLLLVYDICIKKNKCDQKVIGTKINLASKGSSKYKLCLVLIIDEIQTFNAVCKNVKNSCKVLYK